MKTTMIFAAALLGLTGCSEDVQAQGTVEGDVPTEFQIQMTTPVPSEFFSAASEQGTIELLEYDAKDYTRSDRPATKKPAYVYLPYGYDASQKYDVIYLLHGWTGVAQEYFLGRSGTTRTSLVNIFDNLIERGLCRPFIAVSPTWDKDNQSKGWGESTEEAAVFSQEYVNDLIPAVEMHYSTYLDEPTKENIIASRSHRALGGFSLGSITTWYVFEQAFEYTRMYLPMSGDNWSQGMFGGEYEPEATAQFLANLVNQSPYGDDFYVWYAVGTDDVRLPQTHNQALAMAALSDTFNAKNFSYHMKEGGLHDINAVMEFCYHALQFFFPATQAIPERVYTESSTVGEVISDEAFGDFGHLLFPVDQNVPSSMTLREVSSSDIYWWYNYIRPEKTVEIVNYLRSEAASGRQIFYRFYSDEEIQRDPSKANTGLFFFRGTTGEHFAVCNAGGGFSYVGAMHDAFPHCLELARQRLNAFGMIYRVDSPYEDLARAVEFIHDHAEQLGVPPDEYSLWGGSAGARMAATVGNRANLQRLTGRTDLPQAAAVIMQYTGYTTVSQYDAPTYVCVGTSDGIASWRTMQNRLNQLEALGIPTEFHAYDGLPHGFGIGTGTVAEGWVNDAVNFWKSQWGGTSGIRQASVSHKKSGGSIFSLSGQRLAQAQKGINIIDGNKYIIR